MKGFVKDGSGEGHGSGAGQWGEPRASQQSCAQRWVSFLNRAYIAGLIPVSMRSSGEESIRRIGVARIFQILPQGNDASDAVPFVHRILRGLSDSVSATVMHHTQRAT